MSHNGEQWATTAEAPANLDPSRVAAWRENLTRMGAIGHSAFGIQYDLNAAWRDADGEMVGASFCNEDCVGVYNCDAASSRNIGIRPRSLTPGNVILESFGRIAAGIEAARRDFFRGPFQQYCQEFHIPAEVAAAMRGGLDQPGFETNFFGGNPELHPEVLPMIQQLRSSGQTVHLTTTGGSFIRKPNFLPGILEHSPSVIALSADDFTGPDDIRRLVSLPMENLHAEWSKLPAKGNGQRRKAYSAIYTARLAQDTAGFPPIIFNMVLHSGNLAVAAENITILTRAFPNVQINPFPAQSAFRGDEPILKARHAGQMRKFIDQMLDTQIANLQTNGTTHPFVPRLHYWLMLRSVFDWAGNDSAKAMDMITGNGIWQCYRDAPAGFYLQVGLAPDGQIRSGNNQHAGGYLGCFWNTNTVTDRRQVYGEGVTPAAVTQYIQVGKKALAAASSQPCPGCAFPRLTSHIIATETGMDPRLRPFYLARRAEVLGY